jgi:hypothetical protein
VVSRVLRLPTLADCRGHRRGRLVDPGARREVHASAPLFETFAQQVAATEDRSAQHRYNASCAAALAGCGRGKEAAALGDKERRRLRRQARDWLQSDLHAWRQLLQKQPDKAGPVVGQKMRHWSHDPDFDGVRGAALARLPQAERPGWQQLWADVAGTLAKARQQPRRDRSRV